jgi:signal transduction histidine kinase
VAGVDRPEPESASRVEIERMLNAQERAIANGTPDDSTTDAMPPSFNTFEQQVLLNQILIERNASLERRHKELTLAVTELRQAQAQLVHAQKLEAIGSLAAGIAHEINTPTQFVGDNTSFLRKSFKRIGPLLDAYQALVAELETGPLSKERIAEEIRRIRRAKLSFLLTEIPNALDGASEGLGRISSIIRAMKELSYPSNGIRQQTDLRDVIATTITLSRNEWKYVADLETSFDSNLPNVPCLPDELSQVFLNMIVNAAHAISAKTHDGADGRGLIRIETKACGDLVEIRISDNGCGIPKGIQHRIFDPFFTTKPVGTGTGQGLAIAYSVVVDKHHGTISLDSVLGEGTTFTIRLPLNDSSDVRPSKPERPVP